MLVCLYFINSNYCIITQQMVEKQQCARREVKSWEKGQNKDKTETQTRRRESGNRFPSRSREEAHVVKTQCFRTQLSQQRFWN